MSVHSTPSLQTSLTYIKQHNSVIENALEELCENAANTDSSLLEELKRIVVSLLKTRNLIDALAPTITEITIKGLTTASMVTTYSAHNKEFVTAIEEIANNKMGSFLTQSRLGKIKINELVGNIVNQEAATIGSFGQLYKHKKSQSE